MSSIDRIKNDRKLMNIAALTHPKLESRQSSIGAFGS